MTYNSFPPELRSQKAICPVEAAAERTCVPSRLVRESEIGFKTREETLQGQIITHRFGKQASGCSLLA